MNIIFVMSASFPYGQAFSSRARHLVKLLCTCGHHVHVIAVKPEQARSEELVGFDYSVEYIDVPYNKLSLAGIGGRKPYVEAIKRYQKEHRVDLVLSNGMTFASANIRRYTKRMGIPYVIEQCEWFDVSTFIGGNWNPNYREHIRRIEKKNCKCEGVLSISRLFHEHYTGQGVNSIRIPTILDVQNTQCRTEYDGEKINIVFAGSLGKGKENIAPILEAISLLGEDARKLHFNIYGANNAQVLENVGGNQALMDKVAPYVTAHGRIPQQEVEGKFREADYSIFIRPDRQSSHAGFPTKLAESMAVGTPVISNDTGDIGLYLHDGETGFLLQTGTAEELAAAFRKILAMDAQQIGQQRQNARNMALRYFDYREYQKEMEALLHRMG